MSNTLIAAQLYTVREFCKTAGDLAETFRKLRQIGYQSVQISGIGPIDPAAVRQALKDHQLTCCITHIGLDDMRNNPQAVINKHRMWDCQYTAIGGYWPQGEYTRASWQGFADEYNHLATTFAAAGLKIGYHNHSHELAKVDGTTPMQILVDTLKPPAFLEIDTYWITHGGGDPIEWIGKCAGRLPCLHLKDMAITPNREQKMAAVGEGNLNMPGIIAAATRAGTRWFIVEQDDCYGADPFECLATSYRNLRAMGLEGMIDNSKQFKGAWIRSRFMSWNDSESVRSIPPLAITCVSAQSPSPKTPLPRAGDCGWGGVGAREQKGGRGGLPHFGRHVASVKG